MSNSSSPEIGLIDVMDGIIKARGAIGYVADMSGDPQLCSLLMLIEESLGVTEQGLQFMINAGIDDELQEGQDVPFD